MLTPAHFPFSLPPPAPLPLATSLLLLLSLPSCHYSPSPSLLSLLSVIFCLSQLLPSLSLLSVFLPHLLHSVSPPLEPNCSGLIHLSPCTRSPTAEPRPTDTKAVMEHASIIFYHLHVFCFQRYPIILMLN